MLEMYINNSSRIYTKAYFSHCPPIIKPPVYCFTIIDRGSICLCLAGSTLPIRPQAKTESCEIADTVRCTDPSCFLKDVFTFPTKRVESFEGELDESSAQVHVQALI